MQKRKKFKPGQFVLYNGLCFYRDECVDVVKTYQIDEYLGPDGNGGWLVAVSDSDGRVWEVRESRLQKR